MHSTILTLIFSLTMALGTQIIPNEASVQKIQKIQQPIEIVSVERDSREYSKTTKIKFNDSSGTNYFVEILEGFPELLTTKEKTCVGPSAYLITVTSSEQDVKLYLCSKERMLIVDLLNTWLSQNENSSDVKVVTIPNYGNKTFSFDSFKYKKDFVKHCIELLSN